MTEKGLHSLDDMYKFFKKKHPNTDVNESQFKHVAELAFKIVRDEVLDGNQWKIGQRMGNIRIRKVKRTFKKPRINIYETLKLRKEGIEKNVYYTDDYWYRFYWEKKVCQIPNKTVYSFVPTKGANGNTKRLAKRIKNDEFSYLLYAE